ncbi:MAG: N-acetyltransferase [Phycisphaerae bacterium]|nr:N-acetyltransferase [Gemmatimonadaceae bacterium]
MVEHRPEQQRFVLVTPEGEARLSYRLTGKVMDLASTFVPPAARGRGAAAQVVEAALKHARANNLQIVPTCWYAEEFIGNHPEYSDLLEAERGHAPDRSDTSCEI